MQQAKSKEFLRLCKKYGVDPDNVNEVLSFEAACKITGDDPKSLPIVKNCAARHRKRLLSDYMLSIIAEALRTDLTGKRKDVDYTTSDWKYFARFLVNATKKKPSGSGLSCDGCDRWRSFSHVGVRLCFPNYDTAIFFGKHFLKLHTDHHLYT